MTTPRFDWIFISGGNCARHAVPADVPHTSDARTLCGKRALPAYFADDSLGEHYRGHCVTCAVAAREAAARAAEEEEAARAAEEEAVRAAVDPDVIRWGFALSGSGRLHAFTGDAPAVRPACLSAAGEELTAPRGLLALRDMWPDPDRCPDCVDALAESVSALRKELAEEAAELTEAREDYTRALAYYLNAWSRSRARCRAADAEVAQLREEVAELRQKLADAAVAAGDAGYRRGVRRMEEAVSAAVRTVVATAEEVDCG